MELDYTNLIIASRWPAVVLILGAILIFVIRKQVGNFVEDANVLKTKWFEIQRIQKEIFAKAEEVRELSEDLSQDKKELRESTKIFIESIQLILATRNVFPIPDRVSKEIEKNLNNLAYFAVENENERKEWVRKINKIINPNWSESK